MSRTGISLKFERGQVLACLQENRKKHEQIYVEAVLGYQQALIKDLEGKLAKANAGEAVEHYINIVQPVNHLKDYDRAIQMFTMTTDESVSLSEQEFAQYIQDDWQWKGQFLVANSTYSASARAGI
jgi:hypothetical protein